MSISYKKSAQLEALFAMMSEVHRQTLLMTIKAAKADGVAGLPYDELLGLLGDEDVCEDRWQEIFSVTRPLLTEHARRCDHIDMSFIEDVWDYYLRELDSKGASAWLSGHISLSDVRGSIVSTFTKLAEDKKGQAALVKRLGTGKLDQLKILLSLLERSDELEDFFGGWPDVIKNLDETYLTPLREFNEHLVVDSPEITPSLLFLVSTHLLHPYHIFRAVEKITGHSSDRVMIQTDIKVVGDALLDQNDVWLDAFQWQRNQEIDVSQSVKGLKKYIDLVSGWSSEFHVDPAGLWGKRLASQRGRCGKAWDEHMKRIEKSVDEVLPRKNGNVTGRQTMPNFNQDIDEHKVALAENAVKLLLEARPYAAQGGFQSSKDKAVQLLENRLEEQSDDLLSLLGQKSKDTGQLSAHFTVLVRITEAYLGKKDADILTRRSVVAMAA